MGKQGPCYHCGVTSTPLWRNGPPDKPILCNACGSRWRTKGTLVNYTPLHARAEPDDFEEYRVSRVKSISIKNKEAKQLLKRKHISENVLGGGVSHDHHHSQGFRKVFEEDTSNRSSSGSAISNPESGAQFSNADASDLTGPAQSIVLDTFVPSRKRTCVSRSKPSPVEKLTKDLCTILHEQQSSSYFSGSSEEDLLFESETPMVSVEIGHGSVLIRHPSSVAREEESEASSLSVPYPQNETYSRLGTLPVNIGNRGLHFGVFEKLKKPVGHGMQQDQIRRDKAQHEKLQILGNHNSLLCHIDLKDVVNLKEFEKHLTNEEQQQLLKYLPSIDVEEVQHLLTHPSIDTEELAESPKRPVPKSFLDGVQFEENISSFQTLLSEGVFDISLPKVKTEDCRTLKRLALSNLTKSRWVEHYNLLKDVKSKNYARAPIVGVPNGVAVGISVNSKRLRDGQFQNFPEARLLIKSPKRVSTKASYETIDNDTTSFSPRSLFALPSDGGSLMLDSFHFDNESCDQDLLLDVPSHTSFPQAELLNPNQLQASTSSSSIYAPHFSRP